MIKLTDSNGFIFSMYSEDSLLRIGTGYQHYYLSGSYKDQWLTFNVERNSSKYTIEVFDENSEKKVSYSFSNYDVYYPRLHFYS